MLHNANVHLPMLRFVTLKALIKWRMCSMFLFFVCYRKQRGWKYTSYFGWMSKLYLIFKMIHNISIIIYLNKNGKIEAGFHHAPLIIVSCYTWGSLILTPKTFVFFQINLVWLYCIWFKCWMTYVTWWRSQKSLTTFCFRLLWT